MKSIHRQILEHLRSGSKLVLATLVRTSGSTPQKPGSSALFGEKGLIAGTVGGGVLEGEVEHIAQSVLISGISNSYYFNLDGDQEEDGAICGGEAVVLIDAHPDRHLHSLEAMERSMAVREKGTMITIVGKQIDGSRTVDCAWLTQGDQSGLPEYLIQDTRKKISELISRSDLEGFLEIDPDPSFQHQPEMLFLEHIRPAPHLVIAGAGHIGRALAHIGSLLDFEITIIDDRAEFANLNNIPDADHLLVEEIGGALKKLQPGPDTYVVIVTRGHHHDGNALSSCIGSDAAYIGMIGSRKKVATLRKKFLEEGLATPEQWAGIHAPIGLPIGSISVQEIAISIAAELVQARSQNKQSHAK
jgi:xanthine dehydrogenase accessory factor